MSLYTKISSIIVPSVKSHKATVIFLHGSGSNGEDMRDWANVCLGKSFQFDHIKVIFPTASVKPYTPLGGELSTVWFDRADISPYVDEDLKSIDHACSEMKALILEESATGIPLSHIAVGGFSMGGCLALHVGYANNLNLAGIFALSSFLQFDSSVFTALQQPDTKFNKPKLLQTHGLCDDLVRYDWGKHTHDKLISFGVDGEFISYRNLDHQLNRGTVRTLHEWLLNCFSL